MNQNLLSRDDILLRLNEIIDGHCGDDNVYGSIHQDPYKSDIYRLFIQAFEQGMDIGKADALCDALAEKYPPHYEQTKLKNDLLVHISSWWREWRYALTKEGRLDR